MVQPYARRVDRRWVRPCADQLCNSISRVIFSVWHWKGIQGRIQSRRCAGSQRGVWHIVHDSCLRRREAQSLVVEEEKCLVLSVVQTRYSHGATEGPAEIILTKDGLFQAEVIVEPIIRIKEAIP